MNQTKKITFTAIFAAIASVLMFYEFPLPFMPPFLKVDLSGAIILIGAFIFGIAPALSMVLIKDLIHLLSTQTGGAGELADFLMSATLIVVTILIYQRKRTRGGAILGCTLGTVAMSLMGMLTNRFIIIPFYSLTMPIKEIIAACGQINPLIGSLDGYLLFGVLPFNLMKGAILSIITIIMYQRLGTFIRNMRMITPQKSQ